jgi:hypothetical protein
MQVPSHSQLRVSPFDDVPQSDKAFAQRLADVTCTEDSDLHRTILSKSSALAHDFRPGRRVASPLAVENPHLMFIVTSAGDCGCRNRFLDSAQIGLRKSHVKCAQ